MMDKTQVLLHMNQIIKRGEVTVGKIIITYGIERRTGSTTLAISLATGLSFWGNQKVLLVNHSNDIKMEQYMKDVSFQYTLDYLNVFKGEEQYIVNSIHHKLDGIGNFQVIENFSSSKMPLRIFEFLSNIKDSYDFIVIDTTFQHAQYYWGLVDIFLPIIEFDSYCIDEYKRNHLVAPCDQSTKNQICIINKMPLGLCEENHVKKILQA